MEPRIMTLAAKKLLGKRVTMSFSDNKTGELWRSFMPRRKEIQNSVGHALYSVEVYPPLFFNDFNAGRAFEKWAAVEVADFETILPGMEPLTLPAGLYAVFIHKGPASAGAETYQYIFTTWFPRSGFELDKRPHFARMGEKYKNEDPGSEEELWIPVRQKKQQ